MVTWGTHRSDQVSQNLNRGRGGIHKDPPLAKELLELMTTEKEIHFCLEEWPVIIHVLGDDVLRLSRLPCPIHTTMHTRATLSVL